MVDLSKPKRVKNPKLLELVRSLPCLACRNGPSDAHHVTSKGAGGGDEASNLMPLCRKHHREWHDKGPRHMIETYGAVKHWLDLAGRWDVLRR